MTLMTSFVVQGHNCQMKCTFAASLTSHPRPPQSRRTRRTAESARQGRTRRLERERAPGAPARPRLRPCTCSRGWCARPWSRTPDSGRSYWSSSSERRTRARAEERSAARGSHCRNTRARFRLQSTRPENGPRARGSSRRHDGPVGSRAAMLWWSSVRGNT